MTTYNFTDKSILGVPKPPEMTVDETLLVVRRNIIDTTLQNLDAGDGDIAQVINIPANTTVLWAGIRVMTADAANSTVDLGVTTTNADQWGDALSLATANVLVGMLHAPLFFAAADTIDVLATTDGADVNITAAIFEVIAVCIEHKDTF